MKKLNKLLTLCLMFIIVFSTSIVKAEEKNIINDQALAKSLSANEVDTSLAKGWNKDTSMIFTTIFDSNGNYRGYRTTQVFKNEVDKSLVKEYKDTAGNVCTIFELKEIEVEYEGSTKPAIDFICMQSVGNEGVVDIKDDKLTIQDNYGITDGYLVGIQVFNKSFSDVEGGEVKNDVLYVLDNEGGSAVLVDSEATTTDTKQNTEFVLSKEMIIIAGGALFVILLLILIIVIIRKIKKNKNNDMSNITVNNNHTPQQVQPQEPTINDIEVLDNGGVDDYE